MKSVQGPFGLVGTVVDGPRGGAMGTDATLEQLVRGLDARTLAKVFEHAPIGLAVAGLDGAVEHVNAAFCALLGRNAEALLGTSYIDLTVLEDRGASRRAVGGVARGDLAVVDFEKRYVHGDGHTVPARTMVVALRGDDGEVERFVAVVQALRVDWRDGARIEQREALVDLVSDAVIAADTRWRVTSWNRAAEELYGWTKDEMIGVPLNERIQTRYFDTDQATAVQAFVRDGFWRGEVEQRDRQGRRLRVSSWVQAVYEDGVLLGGVAVNRDFTAVRKLEADLTRSQKLEAIGQLAAGVAHEINSPTQFVSNNLNFLTDVFGDVRAHFEALGDLRTALAEGGLEREGLLARLDELLDEDLLGDLAEELPSALQESRQGVDRISKIVRAMKQFAHPSRGEKTPTSLNTVVQDTLTISRNEWKYCSDVVTDLQPSLPLVCADRDELNQVLLNLIVNAAHAIESRQAADGDDTKGCIRISTRTVEGGAEIRIADDGCGVPEDLAERIYEPFFTTKEVGRGSGQGLAIAARVVERHGGRLRHEGAPGEGATFIITLPLDGQPVPV